MKLPELKQLVSSAEFRIRDFVQSEIHKLETKTEEQGVTFTSVGVNTSVLQHLTGAQLFVTTVDIDWK
jgi:hypothetical protein